MITGIVVSIVSYFVGAFSAFKVWTFLNKPTEVYTYYTYNPEYHPKSQLSEDRIKNDGYTFEWRISGWADQWWTINSAAMLCLTLWWAMVFIVPIGWTLQGIYKSLRFLSHQMTAQMIPKPKPVVKLPEPDRYDKLALEEVNRLTTADK